ncbi:MAG: glutathione-disulfide reductase [Devosia sp. 67-54]|uniref:glutathione-disulfide reductase n=1 Tax=unclassified Devosia TaxID=196773 RepID=UPI00096549C4|nr:MULTISPECIES: glutathione-disulfide reductase [unclassified Devosia]MBN9305717.1 glutathione-disulfide reductase [Devosia sp.]OJX19275.1 MAG: glutathione-disulfide reductase [Devosia sp. 67-54]
MAHDYDLIVIGAGSGGVRAARVAGNLGARVAIIEEYRVGGTCVIRGCVPKKLFVYASRFADLFEVAGSFGWTTTAEFDWPTLVRNKDREIARLEKAYVSGLESARVEIIRDRAIVTGPNSVRLARDGRVLSARYLLVATGGHPHIPDIPGRELGFTSNEAFHLERLPHSVLIEGGGYVALEFATIFAGLGVDTTVIYRGRQILRGFDDDLRTGLEAGMQERGVKFIYETTIRALEKLGDEISVQFSDGVAAPFGGVMFATGRRANTAGLGLEQAGVTLTEKGAVQVDKYSRTSVPSIYAVGDVTGRVELTPVAIREGWYFAETVFNDNPMAVDHSLIGTAIFAEPEAATIGLTEAEAATHGDIDVYVTRFRPMLNTLSDSLQRMLLKLVTEADGGKVLGVHVLGPGAAELVQMAAIPLGMGATKADFDRAMAMHPTAAEELVTFKAPTTRYRGGVKV